MAMRQTILKSTNVDKKFLSNISPWVGTRSNSLLYYQIIFCIVVLKSNVKFKKFKKVFYRRLNNRMLSTGLKYV